MIDSLSHWVKRGRDNYDTSTSLIKKQTFVVVINITINTSYFLRESEKSMKKNRKVSIMEVKEV